MPEFLLYRGDAPWSQQYLALYPNGYLPEF